MLSMSINWNIHYILVIPMETLLYLLPILAPAFVKGEGMKCVLCLLPCWLNLATQVFVRTFEYNTYNDLYNTAL